MNKESNDTKVNDPVILDSTNIQLLVVVRDSMINTLRVWIISATFKTKTTRENIPYLSRAKISCALTPNRPH